MRRPRPLEALFALPVLGFAISAAALFVETVRSRYAYPFDLEWMEGGMLVHALRLREGLGIYVEPSADFVPYIYPPLYAWVLSVLGEPSYATARLVTAAGVVAAALAAVAAVRRETGGRVGRNEDGRVGRNEDGDTGAPGWWGAAIGAGAAFLTCYDESGAFFDLARTDGLAVGLMAWALVLCRPGSRAGVIAGGLVLAAAFAAKHNYALFGVPIALWLWRYRGWRRAGLFALASAGPALLFVAAVQIASGGWFLTYLLEVPSAHPLVGPRAWPLTPKELWSSTPWLLGGGVAAGLLLLREPSWRWRALVASGVALAVGAYLNDIPGIDLQKGHPIREHRGVWLGALAGLVVPPLLATFYGRGRGEGARYWAGMVLLGAPLCALMRAHHGGFVNVQIPGYWLMAVSGGLLMAAGLRRWDSGLRRPLGLAAAAALICVQLHQGRWSVEKYAPTDDDLRAGEALIEQIAAIEGEVFAPHFAWYPHMAGKAPSLPLIAIWDIDHKRGPLRQDARSLDRAIADQRWAAMVMPSKPIKFGLIRHYERGERVEIKGRAFKTRSGWPVRPAWIWRPKDRPIEQEPAEPAGGGEAASGQGEAAEPAELPDP